MTAQPGNVNCRAVLLLVERYVEVQKNRHAVLRWNVGMKPICPIFRKVHKVLSPLKDFLDLISSPSPFVKI